MTGDSHNDRYVVDRRTLLSITGGAMGALSGCVLSDNRGNDSGNGTESGNDTTANSTDSGDVQGEIAPPAVAESYTTDDYAYLTANDENYYDYLRTEFTRRQNFTTEFTPRYGALRVNIPEGTHYGTSMWFLPEEQWEGRCDELHVRYWIYIPHDFEINQQLKLPAVGNRKSQGWGGRKSDGTGGWSSHIALNEERPSGLGIEFYTYHADMSGRFGDIDEWDVTMPTGEWSLLDFYIDVNTPGERDGAIRGWLNNEFGHERTGLMFRGEGYEELNIDEVWFTIYHGGQVTSPRDNFLILGDHELWKEAGEQTD